MVRQRWRKAIENGAIARPSVKQTDYTLGVRGFRAILYVPLVLQCLFHFDERERAPLEKKLEKMENNGLLCECGRRGREEGGRVFAVLLASVRINRFSIPPSPQPATSKLNGEVYYIVVHTQTWLNSVKPSTEGAESPKQVKVSLARACGTIPPLTK